MPELGRRGMTLRTGVHKELEDVADALIFAVTSATTKHSDKSDVLTPWKEQSRRSREVYVSTGTPDGAVRRGTFSRAWNPTMAHLNSVEGTKPSKMGAGQRGPVLPSTLWDSE